MLANIATGVLSMRCTIWCVHCVGLTGEVIDECPQDSTQINQHQHLFVSEAMLREHVVPHGESRDCHHCTYLGAQV